MGKKIKAKNYIILGLILVLTIIAVFYARSWYLETKSYYATNSVILDVVKEINEDEIGNYTLENPKFILYVASGENANIKEFEKEIKHIIVEKELENNFLYLNIDNNDKNELKALASSKVISDKIDIDSQVSMYIIENGKINKTIINAEELTSKQIKSLFQKYGVIDNA